MKALLIAVLRGYQWLLSPWLGNQCRFWPTCSEYARQAIDCHGASRGGVLALARILRCQPWATGGIDAVPQTFSWRAACGCGDGGGGAGASQVNPRLELSPNQPGNPLDNVRDAGSRPGHR